MTRQLKKLLCTRQSLKQVPLLAIALLSKADTGSFLCMQSTLTIPTTVKIKALCHSLHPYHAVPSPSVSPSTALTATIATNPLTTTTQDKYKNTNPCTCIAPFNPQNNVRCLFLNVFLKKYSPEDMFIDFRERKGVGGKETGRRRGKEGREQGRERGRERERERETLISFFPCTS